MNFKDYNTNVKQYFTFTFFQGLGRGIWTGNILSAFIYYIANESNTLLGYTSAALGIAMSTVVFPAGYFADKYRRDILMKIAFIVGLVALIIAAMATTLQVIFIALIFWGAFQGLIRPSTESLFADSITSGKRSSTYSWLHLVRQLSMAVGPFINVILFLYLGDTWDIQTLRIVMWVGMTISGFSLFPLLIMSDDNAIGSESDSLYNEKTNTENNDSKLKNTTMFIPTVIITSNLIIGIGAGMTIKFFPIFFISVYYLNPIPVNLILGFTFIFTGLAALGAQKFSLKNGRVQMIILVQGIATACLFLISYYPPLITLIFLYIARGSLMNASQPLSRSILMDVVPKKHRGKVNSIEALAWGLFWNFSAAIGGILIDTYDFNVTFKITASIYAIGTLPLLLIVSKVKAETISKNK